MNLRKLNRAIHRDLGYFFTGMIMVYALSGIALNHINDWNPNYIIKRTTTTIQIPQDLTTNEETAIDNILEQIDEEGNYRKHYFPSDTELKIFLKEGGSVELDLTTGELLLESLKKRPIFNQVNFLHYNPGKLWKWFADLFAGALILLGISGLFILKGKNGITRRGAWLTSAGILIPLILFLMYYI
ncbi:hypothetical protein DMA11_00245 [Marinilabiliaceae bacterium JC017]|nr:hypothetical protein DMA11_00245 [Marinilabiliaceae bacterium JC017]